MRLTPRRRQGERGQTGAEFALLGAAILAIATTLTVAVGGYLAATYDQHHSNAALNSAPSPTPEPPSVVFVDHSPVGLYESCILRVAAAQSLSWDGGELGWTAAAFPRPQHSDPQYDSKLRRWRQNMTGLLARVSASADWQACLKPELTPPPQPSQEPTEAVAVGGTYTIDPAGTQAIGGCGSSTGPTSMTVSSNGSAATVRLQPGGVTVQGTLDTSSYSLHAESTDPDGTKHSLDGSFSSNAGVTRFTGHYDVVRDTAGCGYQFTAQKR